jgi:Chlorophyll A-B binding protein
MKFAVVFASLLASAAAFAPVAQQNKVSTTSLRAFANELGAQQPLGFWDPLGLVSSGDQAKFDRLRFVEIKHGRTLVVAQWIPLLIRLAHTQCLCVFSSCCLVCVVQKSKI